MAMLLNIKRLQFHELLITCAFLLLISSGCRPNPKSLAKNQESGIKGFVGDTAGFLELAVDHLVKEKVTITNIAQIVQSSETAFGGVVLTNKYLPQASELMVNPDIALWTNSASAQNELALVNTFPIPLGGSNYYVGVMNNGRFTNVGSLPAGFKKLRSFHSVGD
ncbi:MAG: hypothetical protein ACO1QB_11045 [Verrucomicrobiales bacterium]